MRLRGTRHWVLLTALLWLVVSGLPLAPKAPGGRHVSIDHLKLTGGDAAVPGWSTSVPITNGAQMVGFTWNPEAADLGAVKIRSLGPTGWSDWLELEGSHDGPDLPEGGGRTVIDPAWVGDGTSKVELQVVHGALDDLKMDALRIDGPAAAGPGIESAGALAAWPGIYPRSAWSAGPWRSDHDGCGASPKVAQPRYAVLHHTVTTNDYTPDDALRIILGIYTFHVESNGWCDIGYNFLVDRFGRIFEGRSGGMDKGIVGGHTLGFNTGSIGVALLGQFQPGAAPPAAPVSAAMRSGLEQLLIWKFAYHGIDARLDIDVVSGCSPGDACNYAGGEVAHIGTITAHRFLDPTACPGDYVVGLINDLRASVAAGVINSGPWNSLPGWKPAASGPGVLALDALGGMHPDGSANAVGGGGYWPGAAFARGISGTPTAGYVADAWGAVHPYGSAPAAAASAYWPGWDIVRGIAVRPGTASGWVLSGWGSLHPFGGAPPAQATAYWPNWDIARGVAVNAGGTGGYVLSGWGSLHPFGDAPPVVGGNYWPGWDIARGVALRPDGPGGYVLSGWGSVHPFGGAPPLYTSHYTPGWDSARGLVILPGNQGYFVDVNGGVWPVGSAPSVPLSLTWTGLDLGRGLVAG